MSIEVMKQALEYTRPGAIVPVTPETVKMLVDALRLAIEQAERPYADKAALLNSDRLRIDPVTGNVGIGSVTQAERQEPVVGTKTWFEDGKIVVQPLYHDDVYTAPPQRQPLTQEEVNHLWETIYDHGNGKYQGEQSRAQRARAFEILKMIGGEG